MDEQEKRDWRTHNTQNMWCRNGLTKEEAIAEGRRYGSITIDEDSKTVWYSCMPCL